MTPYDEGCPVCGEVSCQDPEHADEANYIEWLEWLWGDNDDDADDD